MQQCSMNGDVFRRDDDGKLYLNGKEIVDGKILPERSDDPAYQSLFQAEAFAL